MSRKLANPLIASCAALLILAVSTLSAAWMAPERGEAEAFASTLVFGLSPNDFCGDVSDHDHRCPFCRLVADPPEAKPVAVTLDLRPVDLWRQRADLTQHPLPGNPRHTPRAPPVRV